MKIFGYINQDSQTAAEGLKPLTEVTVVASPSELRKISVFLASAADSMEKRGHDYEHEHLADNQVGFDTSPQLVVFNPALAGEANISFKSNPLRGPD